MKIGLNSVVLSSSSARTTTIQQTPRNTYLGSSSGGGGFINENAINSNKGLALLAALTLKKTLNVNTNNKKSTEPNVFSFTTAGLAGATDTTCPTAVTSNSNASLSSKQSITTTALVASSGTPPSQTAQLQSVTTNSNSTSSTTITTTNNVGGNKHGFQIPSDMLDDLASRFIINVPDMELSNLIRICFQIELAHWFYLDFFCASEEEKKLQPCGIKQFAMQIFQHIPFLRKHLSTIDTILEDWKNYKLAVPTYGAILISEDLNYCLLVQSYFAKCSWGFPKGKINENEDPVHCAAREVYEETGYDIAGLIVPNDYIEAVINYQYTRLYIVRNVSLQTFFSPRTRNEIKCCDWFPIDSLPINKNDAISKAKLGINANSFFMIMPFVKRLKKWVNDKRAGIETRRKFSGGSGQAAQVSSPKSTSPLTTCMTTTASAGGNNNNLNSQKHSNANGSCKKNKHQQLQLQSQSNDDNKSVLKTDVANLGGCNASTPSTSQNKSSLSSSSNRSKRQRHKSMGDLDGIKISNLSNNCKNQSNSKNATPTTTTTTTNTNAIATPLSVSSSTTGNAVVNSYNNNNNNSTNTTGGNNNNHKRNSAKSFAAGSNSSNNGGIIAGSASSKRQLFHSQSQNGAQHGEKIISSFDLIRKEKQQLKAAEKAAKAQKQPPQQSTSSGRVRAKSQSDKICTAHTTPNSTSNKHNNNNITNNHNSKQRVKKQQSMIITNSNVKATKNNSNNIDSVIVGHITPPPISGADLLALAASVATTSQPIHINGDAKLVTNAASAPEKDTVQKPRPLSVSLHFATPPTAEAMQELRRMASGTNLRTLKRAHSHQIQKRQQQLQHNNQQIKFTPSFNSWTNFSFTKNFIANVFC